MTLQNYISGRWVPAETSELLPVLDPATAEELGRVPLSTAADVDSAVRAASRAFAEWRQVPVTDRVQPIFRFKALLEANLEELARTITRECGKTLAESRGELRRGIENVDAACGMPILIQGYNNEDIARGIDEHMFRQPVGVVAAIPPFNFPALVPLWSLPYAVGCGNCIILKPSERVPLTAVKLFQLLEQAGFPEGVVQLVHGGKDTVNALVEHPGVQAISFVGSTPVAKSVYQRAAAHGKRAQCNGGAKNIAVVLPDADLETTTKILAESTFGSAGQRCLATSLVVSVGGARNGFADAISAAAEARRVGSGLDAETEMGPVISAQSRERIERLIGAGIAAGASVRVDGRGRKVRGYEQGSFVFPTVLDNVDPAGEIAGTEIFGPVLGLIPVDTIDEAIGVINAAAYGNMACLFTSSGAAARRFRSEAMAGNIGINVGSAAPNAFYPFSGLRQSFFGDVHAQGRHAVEFYTQTKTVVERWYSK